MKKIILSAALFLCIGISQASAQINQVITYPLKPLRFAVMGEGNFNSAEYPGRYGISGSAKMMISAQQNFDTHNEYVLTLKATHSPATNGNFFKGFDGGNYNNISAIMALVGYRFNFGVPRYMIPYFTDEVGGWFIEANAGASYIHFSRTWAPAFSPVVGYAVARNLDLVGTFTASWADTKKLKNSLFIGGLGVQYTFK